jgi:hypothetical protein
VIGPTLTDVVAIDDRPNMIVKEVARDLNFRKREFPSAKALVLVGGAGSIMTILAPILIQRGGRVDIPHPVR